MKRRVIPILSKEALQRMPTKQLLGRLQALQRCQQSAADSDLTAEEIVTREGILFKDSAEWREAHRDLKSVLADREHIPSAADRKQKRQERGRVKSERKSNPTARQTRVPKLA